MIDVIPPHRWPDLRETIVALYETRGQDSYGEGVSQIEHASQAAQMAIDHGAGRDLIAAAFLHDIGHLLDEGADPSQVGDLDRAHERLGARWIAERFGADVARPIAAHVAAKRYLCAVEPGYDDGLSDASRQSLALQGGPMSAAEVKTFGNQPNAAEAVLLRRWDDGAKIPGSLPLTVRDVMAILEAG